MRLFRRAREYRVTPEHDEWAAPEETLVDAGAATLSDIEMPVGEGIWRGAFILAGVLGAVLLGASAWLAVGRYDVLAQASWRNRTVNVAVPPPRGAILDRHGTALVRNVPSFDVLVVSRQVRRTADGAVEGIGPLAAALGRDPEELALAVDDGTRANAVFFVATDITRDQVLSLQTALPPGFSLITSTKREYTDGPVFSHVIGYVGKVSKQDMARDSYYLPSDTVGRLGVEAAYEEVLRGTHGQLLFVSGGQSQELPASAGANLVLNMDADAQRTLYDSVSDVLREAGLSQAAAVATDPASGAVLAMVSFPSYDNNIFNGALSQADADLLFNNRAYPLLNRVIGGRYNPGSTIKPFIGMAALQEGVMTADQPVNHDCIRITIPNPADPERPYEYENWRPDTGWFTLDRAIADSCNVYFYTVGGGYGNIAGLGVERIAGFLKEAKADLPLGIDLPGEEQGFVPTAEWKRETFKEPWYRGDTYNISIGQGDLLVTPLWINAYTAAIANGGTLRQPQVAARVVDDQHRTLRTFAARELGTLPFSSAVVRRMQQAMRQTVTEGTGKLFQDIGVTAAAKTGTTEVVKGRRINSLVTVYAPAEDPQVALTVLVEGSVQNQGYALRAAHRFLKWFFLPDRDAPPTPAPTPAATPSLAPVASGNAPIVPTP